MIQNKNEKTALVIGSGFGGLAAAVRMRAKGYRVQIFEGRDQLGGRAGVFQQDGFTFDAGPTVITAPYLFSELFELLGEKPEDFYRLTPVDPFYRIVYDDGSFFDYVGSEERLLENIARVSPEDVEGYKKLVVHAQKIFDVGYTQLADRPFLSVKDMVRVLPDMLRLQNYKSVYSLVSQYIKNEKLRVALSFEPLLVGGNPFKITSIYLLIHWLERKWGVYFVEGGTTALVSAFEKLLLKHDVEIFRSASVKKIDIENSLAQSIELEDGRVFHGDLVICNGDPIPTYRNLIGMDQLSWGGRANLKRYQSSMGLFVAYFGTRKLYPELAHHTILLGPRYEGLLTDIFDRKSLAEDMSLYLHAPTRTDKSLAPEGHECFYVLSPVPNNESGIDWAAEGPRYLEKIFERLEDRLLPGLRESLVTQHFVTPDYFENELQSHRGAGFGIEPSFSQSAFFRFHNQSREFQNLYFVGASTHPGAGVPGVINSAKVLERIIPDLPELETFRSHKMKQKSSKSVVEGRDLEL